VLDYPHILCQEGRRAADGAPLMLEVDHRFEDKLLLGAAPDRHLKRV
jgi:hypothetical protein